MNGDTDPRLLRAFVAAAGELHFTRAAARLFVSQQALSRDIQRLEREWGQRLFVRTTRRVALTPAAERLLPLARTVLAAHDALTAEASGAAPRPLVVDVAASRSTGAHILRAAREEAPALEFVARYHSGLAHAATELLSGALDVSFGYAAGLPDGLRHGLAERLVRHERVAVLLPADHRLAGHREVPLDALVGETLYAGAGNPDTAEWTAFARELFHGRGIALAAPFPRIQGEEEFIRVVRGRRWSVLASEEFVGIPGMVLRPVAAPRALSPVSMVWPAGLRHPGLEVLHRAATVLGRAGRWTAEPTGSWLPAAHRTSAGARPRRR